MKTNSLQFKVLNSLRFKVLIWIPAAFCALISVMKMFSPNDAGGPAFYSFLPVCFVFAANVHLEVLKRIESLESALADRKEQKATAMEA